MDVSGARARAFRACVERLYSQRPMQIRKTAPAKAPTHAPTTVVVEIPELLEGTALSAAALSVEVGRDEDEDVGVDGRLVVETLKSGEPVRWGPAGDPELTAKPSPGRSVAAPATVEPSTTPANEGVPKGSCRLKGFR